MVSVFLALLALLPAPQQDQTVFRTEKGDYPVAIRDCQTAETLIDSDPRGAIEKLDAIINNPKIRKIECRIRIEERPAEYSPWYLFLPYQFRGRARMNLARKSDRDAAERLFTGAADDFQKSAEAGVKPSEDLRKAAQAEMEKLKASAAAPPDGAPPLDPLVRFTPGFQQLLRANRFKSARAFIESDGKDLTEAQRKSFADECDRRCRLYLAEQVEECRRRLVRLESLRDLTGMTDTALAALFYLPPPDELVTADPAWTWVREHVPVFREIRAGKAGGEALIPAAAAAASIVPDGTNSWFVSVEELAFQGTRDALRAEIDPARDAPKAERDARRVQAMKILGRWQGFVEGLDKKFIERHPAVRDHASELGRMMGEFPVEIPELEQVDIETCFAGAEPLKSLKDLGERLRGMETGKTVARESRLKLYAAIVTAEALRLLVEGKSEDEAARDLEPFGAKLKGLGGGVDAKKYGPRVQKIVEKLLK